MKIKQYIFHCNSCNKPQPHIIYLFSRKRGVKLMCCVCGERKNYYNKLQFLHEYNPTQLNNIEDKNEKLW